MEHTVQYIQYMCNSTHDTLKGIQIALVQSMFYIFWLGTWGLNILDTGCNGIPNSRRSDWAPTEDSPGTSTSTGSLCSPCMFIYVPICPNVWSEIRMNNAYMYTHICMHAWMHTSIHPSVCPSIHASTCPYPNSYIHIYLYIHNTQYIRHHT